MANILGNALGRDVIKLATQEQRLLPLRPLALADTTGEGQL